MSRALDAVRRAAGTCARHRRQFLAALLALRVARVRPVRFVGRLLRRLHEHEATQVAAGISYYFLLALFPLILGLGAILGWIAGSTDRQQEWVAFVTGYLPGSRDFIEHSVAVVVDHRGVVGILSIIGLLWTAKALFGVVSSAIERAFGRRRSSPFLKGLLLQLVMEIGVCVLFVLSAVASSLLLLATKVQLGERTIAEVLGGHLVAYLLALPALLITFLIFVVLYKFVPSMLIRWRDVLPAALVASLMFEVAKYVFVWYLRYVAAYNQIYGTLASVIVLMVWAYISALVLIIGAEIAGERSRTRLAAHD